VNDPQGCEDDSDREARGDGSHRGFTEEACQERTRGCKTNGEQDCDADVDPEQGAGEVPAYVFHLQQRIGKSVGGGIHKEKAEGGHHGDQTEVARREQAPEDHGAHDLNGKRNGA
jgi:hypothetical protein